MYRWWFNFLRVYSANMDFVLVFPLILTFLSTAVTQQNRNSSCNAMCPAGYHKVGDCDDRDGEHRCEKCSEMTYTAIENSRRRCLRCDTCGNYELELKPCTFNSNVVCDCIKDYYNRNSSPGPTDCHPCSRERCGDIDKYPDYNRKCQPRRGCPSTVSNNTSNPVVNSLPPQSNGLPWLFLVVFPVTLLVIFLVCLLLLLIFGRNWFRYLVRCPCWTENKDLQPPVELARFNEQSSHQGSSPDTLTFHISEETPMVTVSQSPETPEPHISPADDEHEATTQDEPSEHWPAIILYAIIKEVPLRRWKEFLRLLSVADQQLERVELEAGLGLGSMERQYQMLRLWSQRTTASMDDVFSALHYMDLSGCAQLLQESLERLQGRPELKQGSTACGGYTDPGFDGTMQDT